MRFPRWLSWVVTPLILGVALWAVHHGLHGYKLSQIVAAAGGVPAGRIAAAIGLTLLCYAILTNYDRLAAVADGVRIGEPRLSLVSFIAQACGFALGHPAVVGTSIRLRFYTGWGVPADAVLRIGIHTGISFWVGMGAVAGTLLVLGERASTASHWHGIPLPAVGWSLLAIVLLFLGLCASPRRSFTIGRWSFGLPPLWVGAAQLAIGVLDWLVTAWVVYVLLPPGLVSYPQLLGAFVAAHAAGVASQVPGGVGAFEGVMLALLKDHIHADQLMGTLLLFRAIYFLGPFAIAVVMFMAAEIYRRRQVVTGRAFAAIAPTILAGTVAFAAIALLLASYIPHLVNGPSAIRNALPYGLRTAALAGCAAAAVLLLGIAQGLRHDLRSAQRTAAMMLAVGALLALAGGLTPWLSALLTVVAIATALAREHFPRMVGLRDALTSGWLWGCFLTVAMAIAVGLFDHERELTRLANAGQDPAGVSLVSGVAAVLAKLANGSIDKAATARFLITAGASIAALSLVALARATRPKLPAPAPLPSAEDVAEVAVIAVDETRADTQRALVGDEALLIDRAIPGFIRFVAEGRSWIALGEPVGPAASASDQIWRFRERCDRARVRPLFYHIGAASMHSYLDAGLRLIEVGEEAVIAVDGDGPLPQPSAPDAIELVPAARAGTVDLPDADPGHSVAIAMTSGRWPLVLVRRAGRVVAAAGCWAAPAGGECMLAGIRRVGELTPDVLDD
nr:lysylphosphatidylglycerol synthetase family protein [Planctomycetota bacterium]